jgi:hypothetical protein
MFNKTQYKLLIDEYMDKYNITYTNAKQLICEHQLDAIRYDIINYYNISTL